jgi:hypothetical protein
MNPEIFFMYKSNKPEKKFMIKFINPKTDREKTIYFGQTGYEDYTTHKDEERKARYIARHRGMGENYKNPYSGAGFWAMHILWNKPTISASIKDTMEKFDIKIIRKRS